MGVDPTECPRLSSRPRPRPQSPGTWLGRGRVERSLFVMTSTGWRRSVGCLCVLSTTHCDESKCFDGGSM